MHGLESAELLGLERHVSRQTEQSRVQDRLVNSQSFHEQIFLVDEANDALVLLIRHLPSIYKNTAGCCASLLSSSKNIEEGSLTAPLAPTMAMTSPGLTEPVIPSSNAFDPIR